MIKRTELIDWFSGIRGSLDFPIYLSVDVRDSGFKVASVDANIFPAGFNNICEIDREAAPESFAHYINKHYSSDIKKILILSEENTKNRFYWDNVFTLNTLLMNAGYEVRVAIPSVIPDGKMNLESASGKSVDVFSATRKGEGVQLVDGFVPDLILCNNDFSLEYPTWSEGLSIPFNPPYQLGWYQRKKSTHFEHYNKLAKDFSKVADLDPWHFTVETELFSDFDANDEARRTALAERVQKMIDGLSKEYSRRKIDGKPNVFIKNNSGTYGMGVTQVSSGDEIVNWNNKTRTKMKASKGGRNSNEIIIQEGIPSCLKSGDSVAETVIYSVGCDLIGGFLRTHSEKSEVDSLNSPGAVFKRLCMSDLKIDLKGCPMEHVYGWASRLSQLAVGFEAKQMGLEFSHYKKGSC
jgi:glutamate--cysteine ligase